MKKVKKKKQKKNNLNSLFAFLLPKIKTFFYEFHPTMLQVPLRDLHTSGKIKISF